MFTMVLLWTPQQLPKRCRRNGYLVSNFGESQKLCHNRKFILLKKTIRFITDWFFVFPSGKIQYYDKRHLFTLSGRQGIHARQSKMISNIWVGKFAHWFAMIYVFLHFQDMPMITTYWFMLQVTKVRTNAWDALLKARANMSFSIESIDWGLMPMGTNTLSYTSSRLSW
jgi:hypothetical protein